MNAAQQDEYIVQALRMQGAMYEDDARKFLAEHDSRVRAAALAETMRLIDEHPHPGDNPARFYSELLASLLPTGEKATAAAATATPFFQPGHTYTREHHGGVIRFLVRHVSWAPDHSYRVAHGWRLDDDGDWEPTDSDDMDGWTDITTPGAEPDFFVAGRSYLVDGHEFRCRHLDTHPVKQEREAWGWFHRGDDLWQHRRFYDAEYTRATPYAGEVGRG